MKAAMGCVAALALAVVAGPSRAQAPGVRPPTGVRFEQRLGAQVPREAVFREASGRTVRFGELLRGRPLVVAFMYYRCRGICLRQSDGLARCLRALEEGPGRAFDLVLVGIDPRESPAEAHAALRALLGGEAEGGAHALVGEEAEVRRVASALGFGYEAIEGTDLYAHPSGLVVLTPEGRAARYLLGVEYAPRDLRLALVEASGGRVGGVTEQVLLLCFPYDPRTGRYTFSVLRAVQAGGVATVLALAAFILVHLRKERRARRAKEHAHVA